MNRPAALSALLLLGCSRPPEPAATTVPERAATRAALPAPSCDYELAVTDEPELGVRGTITCRGFDVARFEPTDPRLAADFEIDSPRPGHASYTVNLDALARRLHSADAALRLGRSLIAPASSFVPAPRPTRTDVRVAVRVATPPGVGFETGLARDGDRYASMAHEIEVGTYAAFGRFDVASIALPRFEQPGHDASLRLATLDARLALSPRALREWVAAAAGAVATFWGGFPVPDALLVIVPVAGRAGVLFGKLLPESGPAIVLYVGEHTQPAALTRDWILVHELFHLGVPSFTGEGKWFDEGLATYFEPIIRHRAGLLDERELWRELAAGLRQGAAALGRHGVEELTDYRELYWGGAVLCLLADVAARRASGGALGLEHGLRRVLAEGGNASEVWALADTLDTADRRLGAPFLTDLAREHRSARSVALAELFASLGVEIGAGSVELNDAAPLAGVRRALGRGSR